MSDKNNSLFSILKKIFLILFSPCYLSVICLFTLLGLVFDFIFSLLDLFHAEENRATRLLDRLEDRIGTFCDWLVSYFEHIFD